MSYQVLGLVYFGAALAGFVVFGFTFATFTQLAKKYLLERRESKKVPTEEVAVVEPEKEPDVASHEVPAPILASDPIEVADDPALSLESEQPIVYKGKWYAGVQKAAAFLRIDPEVVREHVEISESHKALFDPVGHYETAVRHRIFPLGDAKARLVISDYKVPPDFKEKVSRAYVKRGKKRIPIDMEVSTGPTGDGQLLAQAQAMPMLSC